MWESVAEEKESDTLKEIGTGFGERRGSMMGRSVSPLGRGGLEGEGMGVAPTRAGGGGKEARGG